MFFLPAFFLILSHCDINEELPPSGDDAHIEHVATFHLDIPEPSGITFWKDDTELLVVNDPPNNSIYRLDLDGSLLSKFNYLGNDLEGIYANENTIYIVEEGDFSIVELTLSGTLIKTTQIPGNFASNSGLEGIAHDDSLNEFIALHEKEDVEIKSLDNDLNLLSTIPVDFADDLSGASWAGIPGQYYLVSDESKLLMLWDKMSGLVIWSEMLPIDKMEGIAYKASSKELYIVSDSQETLYIYHLLD